MTAVSTASNQTGKHEFLRLHARYYTNTAKGVLANLRNPELTNKSDRLAALTVSLQFCIGERRWARKSLLALPQ